MTERYELINREEDSYPISSMCRWSRGSAKSVLGGWLGDELDGAFWLS